MARVQRVNTRFDYWYLSHNGVCGTGSPHRRFNSETNNDVTMTDAFVNAVVETDVETVVNEISKMEGVSAAHPVRGKYDILVELDLADPSDLQRLVTGSIQSIPNVVETVTVVSFELAEYHRPTEDRVKNIGM